MQSHYADSVTATLNFAIDANNSDEWSNTNPARTRQNLRGVEVEIRNGRSGNAMPSLDQEGLAIAHHPLEGADWNDNDWIVQRYLPSCEALVQELTGASVCASIFVPLQRRVDYGEHAGTIPAAQFVHLDNTYDSARAWAEPLAESLGLPLSALERAAIYNVWKCITPPPQDYPLAIGDARSIPVADHAQGAVVEEFEDRKIVSPYVGLLHSEEQRYFYFPDVEPDESLVFLGLRFDPAQKMGCPHSAFRHPAPSGPSAPRRSIETRVLAFFD